MIPGEDRAWLVTEAGTGAMDHAVRVGLGHHDAEPQGKPAVAEVTG